MNRSEQRLPVIDGLRALAVVAVVLFHAFPRQVGGGYIGVDVFFVISGFVIALRYLQPMVLREVGYGTFFLRRVRRLVPPYFAMLVATTLAAAWIMVPRDLINFGTSLVAQALYAQNIVFWLQGEYFDAALRKPLLHTWSLAVEEQFYLCFPLLVLTLRRWPRFAVAVAVLLALLSLGLGFYLEQISPKTSFYWLPFRVWEFFAGIGAAMLYRRGLAERIAPAPATGVALLGLAAILAAIALFDEDSASVMTQGLLAVAGTAALCLVQERVAGPVRALFTNSVAQHLGRISYSWYLWHWPPLTFAFLLLGRPAAGWEAAALTLLGYGLGVLSWRLLEQGSAGQGTAWWAWRTRPKPAIVLLAAFLLFAGSAGAALVASKGFLGRYPAAEQRLLFAQMDRPDGRCPILTRLRQWKGQICAVNAVSGPGGILFIGDSHVEMQKQTVAALGEHYGVPVYITKQNCTIVDFGVDRNCKWSVWRGVARDIKRHRITRVVAIALWPRPFDAAAFDAAVQRLRDSGAQLVLERPTPRDDSLAPAYYLASKARWGTWSRYPTAREAERQRPINDAITRWQTRGIGVLDPARLLCPGERCLFAHEGAPLYSDTHHVTSAGMRLIAPVYTPLFAAAARDRAAR